MQVSTVRDLKPRLTKSKEKADRMYSAPTTYSTQGNYHREVVPSRSHNVGRASRMSDPSTASAHREVSERTYRSPQNDTPTHKFLEIMKPDNNLYVS